ncbi:MAG: hypothetical protein QOD99_2315 [Chthoniobacter sp.]|nr:hypothetical protein [Chthoniobacter sp.]
MTPRLRQRILGEWRGLPEREPRPERAQSVGQALEGVMRKLGLKDRLTESQILSAWPEIVGEWFAQHTCPSALRDRVLIVQVIQPTVHYELDRMWKPQILAKLRERFGSRVVRDVKFRVG